MKMSLSTHVCICIFDDELVIFQYISAAVDLFSGQLHCSLKTLLIGTVGQDQSSHENLLFR